MSYIYRHNCIALKLYFWPGRHSRIALPSHYLQRGNLQFCLNLCSTYLSDLILKSEFTFSTYRDPLIRHKPLGGWKGLRGIDPTWEVDQLANTSRALPFSALTRPYHLENITYLGCCPAHYWKILVEAHFITQGEDHLLIWIARLLLI